MKIKNDKMEDNHLERGLKDKIKNLKLKMQLIRYKTPFSQMKERPRLDTFYYVYLIHGISLDDLMKWVIRNDWISILKYIRNEITEKHVKMAIMNGSIQCFLYMWKIGKIIEKNYLFEYAIQKKSHIKMMEVLIQKNIPMTNHSFLRAMFLENLEVIHWMLSHGFVWNETHCFYAIENKKTHVIHDFIQNQNVFSESIYQKLLENNYMEETTWIDEMLLKRKWKRKYHRFQELKNEYLESEFDQIHEKKSIDREFEKIQQSRRMFDCMILFSMVSIEESILKRHGKCDF